LPSNITIRSLSKERKKLDLSTKTKSNKIMVEEAISEIEHLKLEHFVTPPYLVQDLTSDISYIHNCCKENRTTLHKGQRKLFNSLLFFLTRYGKDDDICLYVGSAPGENIGGVAELFPRIKFYLYDPKRTKPISLPNVEIVTNNRGEGVKFTDQVLNDFVNSNTKILLFSDIRNVDNKGDVTEDIVDSDLMLQLSWIEKLKPRAFCLKFRLPFVEYNKSKTSFREYPDGLGLLQPYAPQETTEIRLINESKNIFENGRLKLVKWKLSVHENRMFYLNTFLREWAYYDTDDDVAGGDHCFDCALETLFCTEFLEKFPSTVKKFSSANGKTPISKFRNWISNYNYKLRLEEPGPTALQKEYGKLKFEMPKSIPHGKLPLQNRNVRDYLKIVDPINLFVDVLDKRGNVLLTHKHLKEMLKRHKSIIEEAITHKSMNEEKNYERLEFRGDRILSNCIADYFYEKTTTKDISILNGLLSAFTSGETAAELFAEKLGLKRIIIINEEECSLESAAEDVFEASLAVINLIFNKEYRRGIGDMVCYNIVSSILDEIDFYNFTLKIFPPKTELKELFNENQNKGFNFDKQYVVSVADGRYRDIYDTSERIKVEIKFPPELEALTPPVYEEYGPKARVERNASLLFLEFFKNRNIIPRPKNRDLGLKFKCI
jgi:dsRNA-specific ribonuclease